MKPSMSKRPSSRPDFSGEKFLIQPADEQKLAWGRSLHHSLTGDTDTQIEMITAGFDNNGFANGLEGISADAVDMKDQMKTMEFYVEISDGLRPINPRRLSAFGGRCLCENGQSRQLRGRLSDFTGG